MEGREELGNRKKMWEEGKDSVIVVGIKQFGNTERERALPSCVLARCVPENLKLRLLSQKGKKSVYGGG